MKNHFLSTALLLSLIVWLPAQTFAQQTDQPAKQESEISKISLGAVYKFKATYMYPMKGKGRNLTSDYIVVFSKDTLNGGLPYVGTATSVPYGSSDGGVNLATNNFSYTESVNKKGNYIIKYKMTGSNDITDATFTIYKNGTTDVSFHFFQRDGISYRGNITKIEKP